MLSNIFVIVRDSSDEASALFFGGGHIRLLGRILAESRPEQLCWHLPPERTDQWRLDRSRVVGCRYSIIVHMARRKKCVANIGYLKTNC